MKARFILFAILLPSLLTGQVNLIPNPSFEDTLHCSSDTSVIKTKRWYRPSACGTPDFYYPSQVNWSYSAHFPQSWGGGDYMNNRGYQAPRTGIAYAGFGVSMGAELMAVGLMDSMLPGKTYIISFYTSLAELSVSGLDQINVCFMQDSVTDFNPGTCWSFLGTLEVDAGNQAGNIITDTLSWVLVQDTFIAEGGERYMIIGNIDTAATQYSTVQIGSYYYFDDFDLHCIDCTSDTSEPPSFQEISLAPTLTSGAITISGNFPEGTRFEIFNALGQRVYYDEIKNGNNSQTIFLTLADGTYSYRVQSGGGELKSGKLVFVR
jgi:hypothetical protein